MADVMNLETGPQLLREYLLARGITLETSITCGMQVHGISACMGMVGYTKNVPHPFGLMIPYDETEEYWVCRMLGKAKQGTFSNLVKTPKMLHPSGIPPRVYLPPLIDQSDIPSTLYLCESAIKAIALAQHGYAAIAGNGVWGFYNNSGWVSDFPHTWIDEGAVTKVVILFDADVATNSDVRMAVNRLATALDDRHAGTEVVIKVLEGTEEDPKLGIDDAIVVRGIEWMRGWLDSKEGECAPEVSPLSRHLGAINASWTLCKKPFGYISMGNSGLYNKGSFVDLEAPRTFVEVRGKRPVDVVPALEWIRWGDRAVVEEMVYRPGSKVRVLGDFYNHWRDGCKPKRGDTSIFYKVYENSIPDDLVRERLIDSMAWTVQNRGELFPKAYLFIGLDQGTGKSLLAKVWGRMFGAENYAEITHKTWGEKWNDMYIEKELLLIDDLNVMSKEEWSEFKNEVNGERRVKLRRNCDEQQIDNVGVSVLTMNELAGIPLEPNERRVEVVHFAPTVHYPQGSEWWLEMWEWVCSGGAAALRWELERRDISQFVASAPPLATDFKREITQNRLGSELGWLDVLRSDPDVALGSDNKRSFYTSKELLLLSMKAEGVQNMGDVSKGDISKFARLLGRAGIRRANGGNVVKINGSVTAYWMIRLVDHCTAQDVREDVKAHKVINLGF